MEQSSHASLTDLILQVTSAAVEGAALKDILGLPGLAGERRKVQRLLHTLVQEGKLRREGSTRGTRYWLASQPAHVPISVPTSEADLAGLSPVAASLRAAIRRPISQRTPVPYRREFLDAYQPNQIFYLPEKTRAHLRNIGQPQIVERKAGTYARHLLERLLIDLSYNSSRLEGNTYSILDTEKLLTGQYLEGKDVKETQMILNHKGAIEYLVEEAERIGFNIHTIRNLHALLSANLMGDPADEGRVRVGAVKISGTVYRPLEIPFQIEECLRQFLHTAQVIKDPFEQSFFALVHLPYLEPFMDVNKRTSRLAANIPFIRENLCPVSFSGVPGDVYTDGIIAVYELTKVDLLRDVFVWAYERSCQEYRVVRQTLGEPDPFRLQFRNQISDAVQKIVRAGMSPEQAEAVMEEIASTLPVNDRPRFYAVVETELKGLHEGNLVRYRLREEEWTTWRRAWDEQT